MLGRLITGILKGLVLGGLIGFGLLKLSIFSFVDHQVIAYLAAAFTGVLIGLIAGKPIWAKDARIEAGVKAFVGALLGAGLMFGAQKLFAKAFVPAPLLGALKVKDAVTLAAFPVTSLALIAAVLGGFYDADNTPEPKGDAQKSEPGPQEKASTPKRIAAQKDEQLDLDDEFDDVTDNKKARK